eukprot:scaffold288023_cov35-Prasinocladus_malaysianus.AAC.1
MCVALNEANPYPYVGLLYDIAVLVVWRCVAVRRRCDRMGCTTTSVPRCPSTAFDLKTCPGRRVCVVVIILHYKATTPRCYRRYVCLALHRRQLNQPQLTARKPFSRPWRNASSVKTDLLPHASVQTDTRRLVSFASETGGRLGNLARAMLTKWDSKLKGRQITKRNRTPSADHKATRTSAIHPRSSTSPI